MTETVLAKQGMVYKVAKEQQLFKHSIKQLCFQNAYIAAMRSSKLQYCEGLAIPDIGVQIPLNHAWVLNSKDEVLETTWDEPGLEYLGIVVPISVLHKIQYETRTYGAFSFHSPTFRKFIGV